MRQGNGRVEGKVALISGAARGQGRQHAITLAREGASVIAVDICAPVSTVRYDMSTLDDLNETEKLVVEAGGQIVARQADVRNFEELEAAVASGVDEFGRLDIVVANAGIGSGGRGTLVLTEDEWRDVIDINLTGVWHTVKAAMPSILEGKHGGSVVIIGSTAGLRGMHGIGHYSAAKHGLVGLAKTLAIELAEYNVRVNCVHPTGVRTPLSMSPAIRKWAASAPPATNQNKLPVEMLDPEDVANAVLWLVSDAARYITGLSLPLDAGFTL